ncbi:sulfite exporter TauE/SafE family protein [Litorilituus lipolyticus]|uniref:Probable membrane transporter protein n=1 Tax=Litorilituus lipolyticus TaxID=2491017 RepID=A0A502L8T8_9GAMM|nr:sulfite exporter TauE/SafE family protein [Litorilituus lipolyticus]TPH18473.1 sulfite exporter TauE/SafE family protein [Litorilituus lipolyticus]
MNNRTSLLVNPLFIFLFLCCWLGLLINSPFSCQQLYDYVLFSLLGVVGAIFANSTGAGGGVIFIPMFNQLNFTEAQSVATSFAIQCFGMTAGAMTWYHHYHTEKTDLRLWQGFKRIIALTSITSVLAISLALYFSLPSPASLTVSFSWFSLLLGLFIIVTIFFFKGARERSQLMWYDFLALLLIGFFGGAITAWLSVGVGEIVAIYLIIRRFDINMAVACAVIISAISVWFAVFHLQGKIYWQVVLFAGPAAVLGGIFAKTIVTHLSATKLKLFFACWLLLSGAVGVF